MHIAGGIRRAAVRCFSAHRPVAPLVALGVPSAGVDHAVLPGRLHRADAAVSSGTALLVGDNDAIAPIMRIASGCLVFGLMVHWLPAPTHLVYALLGTIFVAQAIGVVLMPDSVRPALGLSCR